VAWWPSRSPNTAPWPARHPPGSGQKRPVASAPSDAKPQHTWSPRDPRRPAALPARWPGKAFGRSAARTVAMCCRRGAALITKFRSQSHAGQRWSTHVIGDRRSGVGGLKAVSCRKNRCGGLLSPLPKGLGLVIHQTPVAAPPPPGTACGWSGASGVPIRLRVGGASSAPTGSYMMPLYATRRDRDNIRVRCVPDRHYFRQCDYAHRVSASVLVAT